MTSTNYIRGIGFFLISLVVVSACTDKSSLEHASADSQLKAAKDNGTDAIEISDYLTRNIQDEVFYFVMPDRFHNAKPYNDMGDKNRPISYGGFDPSSKWAFHGGDIAGLEAKLDYIQGMGVTAIWMTPLLRNRAIQPDGFGHHGYWVVDFTEIDPHFGSNDDLKSLIAAAHERDIKVFFDIITNHTADVIKYEECHDPEGNFLSSEQTGCEFISSEELAAGKKYTPFVLESEKNIKIPAWLNDPKYYNNRGDSFWEGESAIKGDFVGLDDLDTSQPEVLEGLTEIFKNLISEFRPDGFRIDTVKHVDIEFWQSFGPAITQHAKDIGLPAFFIFGEVFDGSPAGLSKYTTKGKLPSVLDFSFAFNTRDVVFENKSVSQLVTLFDNDDYYRDADSNPNDLLNFIGNHDVGRVGYFIEKGLPDISEDEKVARSKLAHALMYFSRGVPVVYYGDEQGFTGDGGDVDARENMDPSKVDSYNDNNLLGTDRTTADSNFDVNHPLYIEFSKLAQLRHSYKSLRQGEHINRLLDEEKGLYGFSRILPSDMMDHLLVFNFSTQSQQINMMTSEVQYEKVVAHADSTITQSSGAISIEIAPLSYTLLRSTQALAHSMVTEISIQKVYEENDRVFIPFELSFEKPGQFNFAQITVSTIGLDGQTTPVAFDTTPPYRAILTPEQVLNIHKIKVQSDNFNGQKVTKVFDLLI